MAQFWFPSNRHFWALSTSTSSGCFGGGEGGLGSLLRIGSPVDSDNHQEWAVNFMDWKTNPPKIRLGSISSCPFDSSRWMFSLNLEVNTGEKEH